MHETLFKLAVLDALRELLIALPNAPLNEHRQLEAIDRLIKFYNGEGDPVKEGAEVDADGDWHAINRLGPD